MLRLILGRAGSGKTTYAYGLARKAVQSGEKMVFIVPEQFTFVTEKQLLDNLGPGYCLNLEVLSFSRLAHRVFSEYGGFARRYVDEGGRYILMSLALGQISDMLKVYRRQANRPAFTKTLVETLAEYKQCGITPEQIEHTASELDDEMLRAKLADLALIMRTYDALLSPCFADMLDDLTRLAYMLDEHPFLKDKTVVLDAFKGFTPQEKLVLRRILAQAKDTYVTLCSDKLDDDEAGLGLFSPVKATARQLIMLAGKENVAVAKPVIIEGSARFENETLSELESRLFRPHARPYEKPACELHIITAADIYDEAHFAAQEISRLVREEGIRYRDIVVISRVMELYRGILEPVFEKYGIPLFFDERRSIETHPLMALLLGALDIIEMDFRPEHVFRYLKTGLAQLDAIEISLLENYVYLWDIKGLAKWDVEWTNSPEGFGESQSPEAADLLKTLNVLRERVVGPLKALRKRLSAAEGARSKVAVFYEFLCEIGAEKSVVACYESFLKNGEPELADEYRQIWERLMGIFDQTAETLGDRPLDTAELSQLMHLVIANTELAHIPPSLDEVTAGDAERIRSADVKYAFVIGLAEGVFPRVYPAGGILSDTEREKLIRLGLELSPPAEERLIEERYIAYKAFTCASKGIYLTCPRSDTAGMVMRPSYFLMHIKSLFPKADIRQDVESDTFEAAQNEQTAFELLALKYGGNDALSQALRRYFTALPEYRERLHALEAAAKKAAARMDPQKARALFGERMHISPTRLESFGQCRFLFFCRYGLKARARRKAELQAPEIGTLIHFVLERLFSELSGRELAEVEEPELDHKVGRLLDEFADGFLGGLEDKTERFKYLFYRLKENVISLVRHIAKELSSGDFYPVDFELQIRNGGDVEPVLVPLPDGGVIAVEGTVDRVDIMKRGGKTYLRVIDYKSGSKTFHLQDVVYGLNLQMLIYLFTLCCNAGKRYSAESLLPAGVLYMPAKKPDILAQRGEDRQSIEKRENAAYKMSGLVAAEPEVINGMEHGAKGIFIPAKLNAASEPDFNTSIATFAQFGMLQKHIEKTLRGMAASLRGGDIAAYPVEGLGYRPCDYCDYFPVCGHEKGDRVRFLRSFDDGEVWEMLKGERHGAELDG